MGIVHHGTYISYFEVGRVEYMRRRGLDYNSWTELGIHLPVVEAFVRYRKTARFDEVLCVESRLTELTNQRLYLLSMITAVFLPLGFVTSLLGVNVGGVPLQQQQWAFWALCGAFVVGVSCQLWFFRRRGWF